MIENLSAKLIDCMIANEIATNDNRDVYVYDLQVIIEYIIGHIILLSLAFISGNLLNIVIFLLSFDVLRGFTGGFHCKTNIGCLAVSILVCMTVILIETLLPWLEVVCHVGVIISMIIIFYIGAVNHPDLGWTEQELNIAKHRSRITTVLFLILLIAVDIIGANVNYIYYFGMGIVQCAISLVLAKYIRKGDRLDEANN